jgi:hypothetical protein
MVDFLKPVVQRLTNPSRAWNRQIVSFCTICAPGRPVQAATPFTIELVAIELVASFDQRSAHRLSVTLALSAHRRQQSPVGRCHPSVAGDRGKGHLAVPPTEPSQTRMISQGDVSCPVKSSISR